MSESQVKKQRQEVRRYINLLVSNMNWRDRIRFALTGNYYRALKRTERNMQTKEQIDKIAKMNGTRKKA